MVKGKNVLTTGDVAKICNVATGTVSAWFKAGQLVGYKMPGSTHRGISIRELTHFIKKHNIPIEAIPSKYRSLFEPADQSEEQ